MKRTKLTFLLALLMSMVSLCAFAHDFEVDGIYYVYNDGASGSSVSVSYSGDSYINRDFYYSGSLSIPPTVTYNGKTYSVTSIGKYAFYQCYSLTSVDIPNSVTSIENCAFQNCRLTSVDIPNSTTSIANSAFRGCTSLVSISVASGNAKYDSRYNCNAIIETASNTLIIGCKNTTIPNSVTSIGYAAFCNCSSLTNMTIPNSVNNIGDYAFDGCI